MVSPGKQRGKKRVLWGGGLRPQRVYNPLVGGRVQCKEKKSSGRRRPSSCSPRCARFGFLLCHLRRRRFYSRRAPRWARAPQRATSRRSAAIRTFTRARAIKSTAGCRRRARRPRLPTGVPQRHAFRAPRTVGVWVQTKLVDWQMPDLSEFPVPRRRRSPRVPAIRSSRLACAPLQLKPYVAYGADPRAKHRRRRLPHPFSTRYLHRARLHAHRPPCLSLRRRRYDPVKAPEG